MTEIRQAKVLRRMLWLFGLAALLPIGLAAAAAFYQVGASLEEQAFERMHRAAKFQGIYILERLLDTNSKLLELSESLEAGNERTAYLLSELAPRVDAVVTVDAPGNVTNLVGSLLPGQVPGDAGAVPRTAPTYIITPAGSDKVFLAVDLAGSGARLIALLNGTYVFGTEEQQLLNTDFCVFDNLNALYCTDRLQSHLSEIRAILGKPQRQHRLSWESGEQKLFAVVRDLFLPSRFSSPVWSFVAVETEDEVFAPIAMFRWLFPSVTLVAVLLVLLLVATQTRRQLTPLSVLRAGALKLGEGEFDTRIALDTKDEFEELGKSFNNMAGKIDAQFRFLQAMAEVDHILLSSPDLLLVTESIVRLLPAVIPVSAVAIFVADPEAEAQGRLFTLVPGADDAIKIERIEIDTHVMRLLRQSPGSFGREVREGMPDYMTGVLMGMRSLQVFPLRYEQRILGFLCVATDSSLGLAPEVVAQTQSVADRLTVALSAVERQQKLYDQAHFDDLTGLPNRSLFIDRLGQNIAQSARRNRHVAVVYADLDQFKLVNDTLGHSQGDAVLQQAAARFSARTRKSDTVCRLSGDEFVFALPELEAVRDVVPIVEGLVQDLLEPFTVMDQNYIIGASFGIAIYPQDGTSAEELMKNADVAMYRAKRAQNTHYRFFEEGMNAEIHARAELAQQLRQAVRNRELQIAYQPKVDALTGRVQSAEALLRWKHPTRGWINPDLFIPVAEESGLINEIGEFVLIAACKQIAQWRSQGYAIEQVAVNVSARQVLHTDIVGTVKKVLSEVGVSPACLELELTESLLVGDFDVTYRALSELQELGVALALDDFGTGYSSMSYLHQLPFDTLKIDKSFVAQVGIDPNVGPIIGSIIALAKSLNKKIVAEGIETEEQREFLVARGCELLQGYLYSRALLPQEFMQLLQAGHSLPLASGAGRR